MATPRRRTRPVASNPDPQECLVEQNPTTYRCMTKDGPMKRQDFLVTYGEHRSVLAAFEHPATGEIKLALRKATT